MASSICIPVPICWRARVLINDECSSDIYLHRSRMCNCAVYLRSVRPHAEGLGARWGAWASRRIVALHAGQLVSLLGIRRHDGWLLAVARGEGSLERHQWFGGGELRVILGVGQIILESSHRIGLSSAVLPRRNFFIDKDWAPLPPSARGYRRTLVNILRRTLLGRNASAWLLFPRERGYRALIGWSGDWL